MANCPWHGMPCECREFPWTMNGIIPKRCETDMPIEMASVRKVSEEFKNKYKLYLIPCKRCKFRFEKEFGNEVYCLKCEEIMKEESLK